MSEWWVVVLITLLLVALNGLFVAAEFALIGASRSSVAQRASEGDRAAGVLLKVLSDPAQLDRQVATAQLGITFASLGLGMYGEHMIAGWIGDWLLATGWSETVSWIGAHVVATISAVALLTYLHIVFGEMIPKALALGHAEKTALVLARPMQVVRFLLYPLVMGLNRTGNGLLRLIGITRQHGPSHYMSAEELHYVVEESEQRGLIGEESSRVLRELIEFSELTAREVMVPRVKVVGLPVEASAAVLREGLRRRRHTRYPVYEDSIDHIIGVVHIKDLLRLLRAGEPLRREGVRACAYVPEGASLDAVLKAMREARNQMVVVMDEHGGTAGIVSMEDLCAEALGDIEEGSESTPEVTEEGEGVYRVQGVVRVDEIGERFGLELEHEEVDTVSGLVLALLERPARVGDVVQFEGLRFEVLEVYWHGVQSCRVSAAPMASDDAP